MGRWPRLICQAFPKAGRSRNIRIAAASRQDKCHLIIFTVIASPSAALRINSPKQSLLSLKRLLRVCGPRKDNQKTMRRQDRASLVRWTKAILHRLGASWKAGEHCLRRIVPAAGGAFHSGGPTGVGPFPCQKQIAIGSGAGGAKAVDAW